MRIRDHPGTAAAMLLAGVAALQVWVAPVRNWPLPAAAVVPARPALPAPGTRARKTLEWCRENVSIVHDVYWAAACATVGDDSPDCTLPYERARSLNAARDRAEQQCLDEALSVAGRAARP